MSTWEEEVEDALYRRGLNVVVKKIVTFKDALNKYIVDIFEIHDFDRLFSGTFTYNRTEDKFLTCKHRTDFFELDRWEAQHGVEEFAQRVIEMYKEEIARRL